MKTGLFGVMCLMVAAFTASPVLAGTCTVYVTFPSGEPRSSERVVGAVELGGMTEAVLTDSKGKAVVTWSSDYSLSNVYVGGMDRGPCKNGSTVRVTMPL